MTGTPSASPRPCATSLPSEPISRVIAMIGIFPSPGKSLALNDLQCTPLALARIARPLAAGLHLHRAILELRDLAEGVERRVGEQIGRRFIVGERDEHRTARRAGVGARV